MVARERAAVEKLRELAAGGGRGAAAIGRARAHDEAHARRLAAELRRLGGRTPATPAPGGAAATTPLLAALAVKQDLYARYLEEMPLLRAAALRSLVAEIAVVEAEHVAALRAASGAEPLDDRVPRGRARMSEDLLREATRRFGRSAAPAGLLQGLHGLKLLGRARLRGGLAGRARLASARCTRRSPTTSASTPRPWRRMLGRAGGQEAAPARRDDDVAALAGGIGDARTPHAALVAAQRLEAGEIAAFEAVMARMDVPKLLQTFLTIAAADGQHRAAIRLALGEEPVPRSHSHEPPITRRYSRRMPNIGPMELVIVFVIALIVLGPKRLPEVGRSIGSSMREFKDAISGEKRDDDDEDELNLTTASKS